MLSKLQKWFLNLKNLKSNWIPKQPQSFVLTQVNALAVSISQMETLSLFFSSARNLLTDTLCFGPNSPYQLPRTTHFKDTGEEKAVKRILVFFSILSVALSTEIHLVWIDFQDFSSPVVHVACSTDKKKSKSWNVPDAYFPRGFFPLQTRTRTEFYWFPMFLISRCALSDVGSAVN